MNTDRTIAVHGDWVLTREAGTAKVVCDRWVVIEGGIIAAIAREAPSAAERIVVPQSLILPGLINAHNHGASSVMFRGLTEDWPAESFETELIYGLLMPLGDLAVETLSALEMQAVLELALLEIMHGGTTTLMEIFRSRQAGVFQAADALGLRFYGAPYVFASDRVNLDASGTPTYETREHDESDLDRFERLHRQHHRTAGDRIRVAISPHGLDTCDPDTLRRVREVANEHDCLINIHVCQTESEVALLERRYAMTPTEYMASVDLLGPDVLAAHCLHASDEDLARLATTGTTIVNCPMTFARGGVSAAFQRFRAAGARTVIGTDGYYMDMVAEMRSAGLVSKLHANDSGAATAWELFEAATMTAAQALGRSDIGALTPGARADLIAVSLAKPHFQPVSDPLKTYLWNARGAGIEWMIVDGEPLIADGKLTRKSEQDIIAHAVDAIRKVWTAAREAGIQHVPEV